MTRIKSLTVAAIAAFGISLTPVPAAADSSDVAKVIAGLAVLGIIAKAADDRRDRKRAAAAQSRNDWYSIEDGRRRGVLDGELRSVDKPKKQRWTGIKRQPLPDRCLRIADTNRRDRLVYTRHCLKRNYKYVNRLPDACERQIRTSRGLRTVYGARCLARDGWRVASR